MKVFISWSGPLAKAVAEFLDSWLPNVIQSVEPWLSSEDIKKGSIWSVDINEALSTSVGILCVTQENKNAPWLLFEAGGLSKGLTKSRVCPLLIDLESKDLGPPLSQFNHTLPNSEDMWKLIKTINAADAENALDQQRLGATFAQWWPDFDTAFKDIRAKHRTSIRPQARSTDDMIVEILEISRAVQRNTERPRAATAPLTGYSGYVESPNVVWDPAVGQIKLVTTESPLPSVGPREYIKVLEVKKGKEPGEKPAEKKGAPKSGQTATPPVEGKKEEQE